MPTHLCLPRASDPSKVVVALVMAGGCVDLSAVAANPNVTAIVFAGYPGQSGGTAIAEVASAPRHTRTHLE